MTTPEHPQDLMPLIAYTRKFAALVAGGVSLRRCLELLQATTKDPILAAANADLSVRVCEREETLSAAMGAHPQCFSPTYVAFIHAGEIGGVLDETLADLADWLEQEQFSAEQLRDRLLLARLAAKVFGEGEAERDERARQARVADARRLQRAASFCRLFERCLTAGVPLKLALTTAAEVLGKQVADQVERAAGNLGDNDPIALVLGGIAALPPVVADMVRIGEETGALADMLRKAAQFVDAEAARMLH
jgi:type II secretory pathway component PulF